MVISCTNTLEVHTSLSVAVNDWSISCNDSVDRDTGYSAVASDSNAFTVSAVTSFGKGLLGRKCYWRHWAN